MPTMPKADRPKWMPERKAHEGRTKPNQDIYNNYNYRKRVLNHKMRNPLCVMCQAKGIETGVYVTDHIIPINQGGAIYDENNWQSLCEACHNSKSGSESRQGNKRFDL